MPKQFPSSAALGRLRRFASVIDAQKLASAAASYTEVVATCLSFHATYRCQHAGACCEAAWEIEVDAPIVDAVSLGRLKPIHVSASPFRHTTDDGGRPFVAPARTDEGTCSLRHEQRCSLQRAGGEAMLPTACRHFPRVYRREPHGDRLTLSHFCPTAAALLLDPSEISIVPAHAPLALQNAAEGLNATTTLPPLLRPGMLMDHPGYDRWEALVIEAFARAGTIEEAFARITAATERIRRWHPADGELEAAVRLGFDGVAPPIDCERLSRGFEVLRAVTGEHPLLESPADFPSAWRSLRDTHEAMLDVPLRKYLAACTFANWIAYRGQGLRSIVEWLRACFDVFRLQITRIFQTDAVLTRESLIRAFRDSDYLIVHTVDSLAFGRAISRVE